jgi:SAM-dependent methyltransferase
LVESPDGSALGLLERAPDPLRYSGSTIDEIESTWLLLKAIPRGARVLDVGCGTGSISRLITEHRSAQVVGVEPDPDRAAASNEGGIPTHHAFWNAEFRQTLPTFDVVLFADVLEHLADPFAALVQAHAALNPDGLVVVVVPNVTFWSIRLNLLRGRFDYQPTGIMDATHLRWFTRRTVTELLSRAGFVVQSYAGSAGLWQSAYARFWWLPSPLLRAAVRTMVRIRPALFACQHVLMAQRVAPLAAPHAPNRACAQSS